MQHGSTATGNYCEVSSDGYTYVYIQGASNGGVMYQPVQYDYSHAHGSEQPQGDMYYHPAQQWAAVSQYSGAPTAQQQGRRQQQRGGCGGWVQPAWLESGGGYVTPQYPTGTPPRRLGRKPRDYYTTAPKPSACAITPIAQQGNREFESMRAVVCAVAAIIHAAAADCAAPAADPAAGSGDQREDTAEEGPAEQPPQQHTPPRPRRPAADDGRLTKTRTAADRTDPNADSDFDGLFRTWSV
eukprot:TRINITY_DN10929_c0_g1_i1.p1 TRINITY_DN10929_c0_g1~~TRINITY_DN10929_c0_g1_i1.p1  ORF type:complete len:241 (+),score=82.91 TRINITY_DN10929_c0_g1_i1:95-817(+)